MLLVQGTILGILVGGMYALMASGLTLIFGVMRLINIAHAAVIIFASYLSWSLLVNLGIDPLISIAILMIVFLFSAAAVPLITVPAWWADASRALSLTSGVATLCRVLFQHQPVNSPWGIGGLVWLLVTAPGYLIAGILAFRLGERTAKRRGTLGRY